MISEKLAEIYTKIEDKYFNALDFFDHRGIPVYAYSDFFENRGIPSFVVTIAIIITIIALLSLLLVNPFTSANEMTLYLKDASGASLQGVTVKVLDEQGNTLFGPKTMNDGDKITLPGNLVQGSKIRVVVSKDGYQPQTAEFVVGTDTISGPKTIFLSADFAGIDAMLFLTDSETQTKISGATVLVTYNEVQYKFIQDSNGMYKKSGVPENTSVLMEVTADGYNPLSEQEMESIALVSPTVKQGIIWDSGKKQFQLIDTELLRKQIDEKSERVLWASWRNRVETKPGVTSTD